MTQFGNLAKNIPITGGSLLFRRTTPQYTLKEVVEVNGRPTKDDGNYVLSFCTGINTAS